MDRLIRWISPGWALRRALARHYLGRLYDAAASSQYRKPRTGAQSGNAVMTQAQGTLRATARYLDENHDLAIGVLDTLVSRIVGTGIVIEPMIKDGKGELASDANEQVRRAWREWCRQPEASTLYSWGTVQRLVCRSWLRDGEIFAQHVEGALAKTAIGVPYMLELIEADLCPMNAFAEGPPAVIQGIEVAGWSRPIGAYFFKQHPGDVSMPGGTYGVELANLKRIPWDSLIHLRLTSRLHQLRGVTILHGVLTRLDDLRDYEESERVAARVAAAFCAYIRRSPDFSGQSALQSGDRSMEMSPGMIFDNLLPGEEIGTIGSDRPHSGLADFRGGQLRAVAGGTRTNYSSISKNYDGTYSAQRQELVESRSGYDELRQEFVDCFVSEVYRRWLPLAIASGTVRLGKIDKATLFDADFRGPGVPWIDPLKETQADALAVDKGFKSRHQVIRERGNDPIVTDEQLADDTFVPKAAASTSAKPAADQAGGTQSDQQSGASEDPAPES